MHRVDSGLSKFFIAMFSAQMASRLREFRVARQRSAFQRGPTPPRLHRRIKPPAATANAAARNYARERALTA